MFFPGYNLSTDTDPGLCGTRHHKTRGTREALGGRTHRTAKGRSCHTDTRTDKTDREAPRAPLGGRRSSAHANAEPRPPLPTRSARTAISPGPQGAGHPPSPGAARRYLRGRGAAEQRVRPGPARERPRRCHSACAGRDRAGAGPGGRGTRNYGVTASFGPGKSSEITESSL